MRSRVVPGSVTSIGLISNLKKLIPLKQLKKNQQTERNGMMLTKKNCAVVPWRNRNTDTTHWLKVTVKRMTFSTTLC